MWRAWNGTHARLFVRHLPEDEFWIAPRNVTPPAAFGWRVRRWATL